MSGRASGYYGPADADAARGCLVLVLVVVGILLLIAVFGMVFGGAESAEGADIEPSSEYTVPASESSGSSGGGCPDLAIDVTNSRAMHEAGLPTKVDVISWHIYGRWGFSTTEEGIHTVHIWEDLPGEAWVWDVLYGLDNTNPAYRFR